MFHVTTWTASAGTSRCTAAGSPITSWMSLTLSDGSVKKPRRRSPERPTARQSLPIILSTRELEVVSASRERRGDYSTGSARSFGQMHIGRRPGRRKRISTGSDVPPSQLNTELPDEHADWRRRLSLRPGATDPRDARCEPRPCASNCQEDREMGRALRTEGPRGGAPPAIGGCPASLRTASGAIKIPQWIADLVSKETAA